MKDTQAIISIIAALLLALLASLNFQLAVWVAIGFLFVYAITALLRRKSRT